MSYGKAKNIKIYKIQGYDSIHTDAINNFINSLGNTEVMDIEYTTTTIKDITMYTVLIITKEEKE